MKKIKNYILIYFISVILGLLLLVGAFCIPVNKKNIKDSAYSIAEESAHFRLGIWQLDNFTDELMINHVLCDKNDANVIQKAVNVFNIKYPDSEYGYCLNRYFDGDENYVITPYSRYWHGYLIFLKPLFILLDYSEIRVLNMCIQMALFGLLCYLMYKNGLKKYIPAYLLIYYMISPVATGFSLQYSSIYYISVIFSIIYLKYNGYICNNNFLAEIFLIAGILVSYFDYLTYPIFSLCLILLTLTIFELENNAIEGIYFYIKRYIICSVSWCFGYVLMWSSKWLVACIVNRSIEDLKLAVSHIFYRSSSTVYEKEISVIDVIFENIVQYKSIMFVIPVIICLIIVIYKQSIVICKKTLINMLCFIIIALYPAIWYIAFRNHSYIHAWYTCRSLAISVGAGVCGLMQLFAPINNNEHEVV